MPNNDYLIKMGFSEFHITQERMSYNVIMEILKSEKYLNNSYTSLFFGLTAIESLIESAARIRYYSQLTKEDQANYFQLVKYPDIYELKKTDNPILNEKDLITSIAIGVLVIKFIDDIIKIKYNFRPTEEIEKSGMNFLSGLISADLRHSIVDAFERTGLSRESLMSGFKQFICISAMLLVDKYLSDNVEKKLSNIGIADLAVISSVILISEKELMKRLGNFLAPNVNEQGNHPQNNAQAILPPQIDQAQQPVRTSGVLAEQAVPIQQNPSQLSSALTQNSSSLSPRDNRSGVQESIASQTEVRESIGSESSPRSQSSTANTAPSSVQVQSLRSRLVRDQSTRD